MSGYSAQLLTVALLLATPCCLLAQEDISTDAPLMIEAPPTEVPHQDGEEILQFAEKQPEFPGGMQALMKYLSSEIKYPEIAQEEGAQGKVFLSFVVERDGTIADVRVIRGVHQELDREAVRAVRSMPKWSPGEQGGKQVRTRYTLPVAFQLQ